MFIDQAHIVVSAGKGGNGKIAFRREKHTPKGGPDGGSGGKGGDIVFVTDEGLNTLIPEWKAKDGVPGGSKNMTGANADDKLIRVPAGTEIYHAETGELLADMKNGDEVVIAHGGAGGFGNDHFKNAVNQAPRKATPGEEGEVVQLRMELKVIAEVGLVGFPNAGKSTLLKGVTRADPKIADYPFTTLSPQLGIAQVDASRRVVIADIPGLIEGAADGAGLGHDFLRHIERTRVIVHVLDAIPLDESSPAENYRAIRQELMDYSVELAEKPELIALNKLDLIAEDERDEHVKRLRSDLQLDSGTEIYAISGATGIGTGDLLDALWSKLHKPDESAKW
jgi:GTP-binding protein